MKTIIYIKWVLAFFLCNVFYAYGQVEVSEKIILTSPNASDRQVKGLAYPDAPGSGVSAGTVISGQLIYDAATGSDTLLLQFNPAPTTYTKGMLVNFKSPVANDGAVWINVNGLGVKQLYKNVSKPIDSAEIISGQMVSAMYDGNNFQVTSKLNRPCPEGFVEANSKYCIQQNENDSLNYFAAMNLCGSLNAKICTWAEWYYACQKTSLGLSNMLNNYEFTDDAANYQSDLQIRVVGNADCTTSASIASAVINIHTFRCCYYKR